MGFWNALKQTGSVLLGIEHVAAPIAEVLLPAEAPLIAELDGWVNRIHNTVVTVEKNVPIDGQGQLKLGAVQADFEAALALWKSYEGDRGNAVQYDTAAFQAGVAGLVTFYNSMATVKSSVKVVAVKTI